MASSSSALSTLVETMRSLALPRSRRARRYAIAAILLCAFTVFWGYKREVDPVPPAAGLTPPPPPSHLDPAIAACLDSSEYLVGAARADITGPLVDISTGYNEPGVTMEGLAMKLYARAFVIESPCSGKRVAYVNVDALHMYESLKTGVVKRLAEKLPGAYDDANLLVAATHDHAAPTNVAFRALYNMANGVKGFDTLNYDVIVDGVVSAISRAHEARRPAAIEVARGHLGPVIHNRSSRAYAENRDAADYADNVDDTMTLLRFTGTDGRPIGALNWFAHHPTSLSHEFRLVHGDSKGYAAYRMEAALSKENGVDFVAGFSNGAMGDVTMNAPDVANASGPFRRPSDSDPTVDDARVHGEIQLRRAMDLFREANERVHGGVFFRYHRSEFQDLPVDPAYGAASGSRTCVAAIGAGFVSGTEEGGTVLFPSIHEGELVYRGRPINPFIGGEMRRCQGEKQVLLPAGDMPIFSEPWVDTAVPFQILAVGNVAVVGTSFEQTTMVGRRARKVLAPTLAVMGASDVVIASIANSYNMYMATREEYAQQHFEGSFTQFGPWSSAAWLEQTDKLARALVEGREMDKGPAPVDHARDMNRTWIDRVGVLFDSPPWGGNFGDVANDVAPVYAIGRASATFWSAHPRTAQLRQRAGLLPPGFSFLEVQRQEGTSWVTVAVDGDPSTRFRWTRWGGFMIFPYSQVTIEWDLHDATPGRYRIVHHGVAKRSWLGADDYPTFVGTSSTFEVSSGAHDDKTSIQ